MYTAIFSSLVGVLLREWELLFGIAYKLIAYFIRKLPSGLIEVEDDDTTLELQDAEGHHAVFHRTVKVRFLQNYVFAFVDRAWGDGNPVAWYEISPGHVVDIYKEDGYYKILTSLREPKMRDDTETFRIRRYATDQFTRNTEWIQAEVWHKYQHLRRAVIFPLSRPCRRAVLIRRSTGKVTELGTQFFEQLPDGRQLLSWEKDRPKVGEIYTIRWEW